MRRSLVLAAACAIVSVQAASAADMPTKAPAYAPASAPAPYDWTGFYIGGHAGGAWSSMNRTGAVATTGVVETTATDNASSLIGGAQIGYNWMLAPNWVVGLEADISGASLSGSDTSVTGNTVGHQDKVNWFGTARGRVGYAWSNWLLYATGGAAWANNHASRTQITSVGAALAPAGTVESASNTKAGYAIGGGLEMGISRNWTVRAEYLYLGFGSETFTYPISNRADTYKNSINVARLGVNYRF